MSTVSRISALIVSVVSVFVLTGCPGRSPESRADWVVNKIEDELKLDEKQNAKLHDVKNALLEARKRWKENRNQMIDETKAMIVSEKLDQAKAKAMLERRQKMNESEFEIIYPKLSEFHATLNPEQKKKFVALIEKVEGYIKD